MKRLSENTFTILTTHFMLDDLQKLGAIKPYSVAPTQHDESALGYDVSVNHVKLILLQFKRPNEISRGIRFYLDPFQIATLKGNVHSNPGLGYFCFPEILYERDLQSSIRSGVYFDHMYYVDVLNMDPTYDKVLIDGGGVYLENGHHSVPVPNEKWARIKSELVSCKKGLRYLEKKGELIQKTDQGIASDGRRKALVDLSRWIRTLVKEGTLSSGTSADLVGSWMSIAGLDERDEKSTQWKDTFTALLSSSVEAGQRLDFANGGIRNCQFTCVPLQ